MIELLHSLAKNWEVSAVFVAGAVALVGMVITQQQKITEFRQAWIDAVRLDLSFFIAKAIELSRNSRGYEDQARLELEIKEAAIRIKLRLNPDNDREIIELIKDVEYCIRRHSCTKAKMLKYQDNLISKSQNMLKTEWVRVKSGEKSYRWVFGIAACLAAASFLMIAIFLVDRAIVYVRGLVG